jgi:hypothetical protein
MVAKKMFKVIQKVEKKSGGGMPRRWREIDLRVLKAKGGGKRQTTEKNDHLS